MRVRSIALMNLNATFSLALMELMDAFFTAVATRPGFLITLEQQSKSHGIKKQLQNFSRC